MILSFICLSISYFFLILSCVAQECMRVTAGVPVQQMNTLIRWPFRGQKLGDCTLIAFYPYSLCTRILSQNLPFSFPSFSCFSSSIFLYVHIFNRHRMLSISIVLRSSPLFARRNTLIYIYKISVTQKFSNLWLIVCHDPTS